MKNKYFRKDCNATLNKLALFYYKRRVNTVSSYLMVFPAALRTPVAEEFHKKHCCFLLTQKKKTSRGH